VIDPGDTEGLAIVLRQIALDYDGFRSQFYHPNKEFISQYDRQVLTGQLANLLDHVVDTHGA
jgi:hypothetical protein